MYMCFQTRSAKKTVSCAAYKEGSENMAFVNSCEAKKPTHVVGWIDSNVSVSEFLHQVKLSRDRTSLAEDNNEHPSVCTEQQSSQTSNSTQNYNSANSDFVMTGLHACGDLTPTMMRVFVNCITARSLVSVACCYHKLTPDYERIR